VNGTGGVPYSDDLITIERFTRADDKHIAYEMRITDPKTYTAPWTVAFTITQEPGYQIFEYACHEGNYAMHNRLSAARAEEAEEAAKPAK
jgi:DNA-binding GntR family transcriptional regulator